MKFKELIREVEGVGCYFVRHGSSHDIYFSPVTGKHITIPRHPSVEASKGICQSIRKSAGIGKPTQH